MIERMCWNLSNDIGFLLKMPLGHVTLITPCICISELQFGAIYTILQWIQYIWSSNLRELDVR